VKNNFEVELKRIGQKIKEIRIAKKLTQSSLASSCDVDIRTIQRIEKGTFNMSIKILYLISDALETNPSELLMNKDSEKKGSIYSQ
jgi:transcriptional regulator with XRE-family HTH domain